MVIEPRILEASTQVIGPHNAALPFKRNVLELNPGDPWPLPYRGSRYSVRNNGSGQVLCWKTPMSGARITCTNASKEIIETIKDGKRGALGSFRITPHREVITKYHDDDTGKWPPIYLGKIEGLFEFGGFDLNPTLETGMLWTGLMFNHGEPFSVWSRQGADDCLHWKFLGIHFRTVEAYPKFCRLYREIRPRGGRLYITECGHIWMNVPTLIDLDVGNRWRQKIKDSLEEARESFETNDILLSATHDRVVTTKTYPIYVGRVEDYGMTAPPRTYFKDAATRHFGRGGENADDGGEYYGGKRGSGRY